jgi:hypothetical protein
VIENVPIESKSGVLPGLVGQTRLSSHTTGKDHTFMLTIVILILFLALIALILIGKTIFKKSNKKWHVVNNSSRYNLNVIDKYQEQN